MSLSGLAHCKSAMRCSGLIDLPILISRVAFPRRIYVLYLRPRGDTVGSRTGGSAGARRAASRSHFSLSCFRRIWRSHICSCSSFRFIVRFYLSVVCAICPFDILHVFSGADKSQPVPRSPSHSQPFFVEDSAPFRELLGSWFCDFFIR